MLNKLLITVLTYKAYMIGVIFSFVFSPSASAEKTPTHGRRDRRDPTYG